MHKGGVKKLLFLPLLVIIALAATPRETWQLVDRFKNVSAGEWVKLKYSGGPEHVLLVAAKDDKSITLEEIVREQGYLTSWTQIVVDLKTKLPVLARERMPLGEIRETKIEGKKSNLNEDFYALLTARFWEEPGTRRVVVPAGTFSCQQYEAVFNKKLIRVYFSNKIPLYPVMVVIPSYELTVKLAAFGKGKESRFFPREKTSPRETVDENPVEDLPSAAPARSETTCGPNAK